MPQKLIPVIIERSGINPEKQVNSITKQERMQIVKLLKEFDVTLRNFRRIEDGIITAGGISIKEVNPKTMESKLISGLYFAGEILDVDSYTGGFNLQIAYSTGFVAGKFWKKNCPHFKKVLTNQKNGYNIYTINCDEDAKAVKVTIRE